MNTEHKIDFVIPWVDGNDPEWIKAFDTYIDKSDSMDASYERYRSWDNLEYWFRSVEKFAPWVHKIHFITWGHVPKWMNIHHPKLNIVKHEDYMIQDHLPVFNSHAIEVNLHKIEGLSERFVYFNDDTFILNHLKPERFFKNGLPRDIAVGNIISFGGIEHIFVNNIAIINKHFSKKLQIKSHFIKWFTPQYGTHLLKTLCLLPWRQFSGFFDHHQAQAFLKETYRNVWDVENEVLQLTSQSKFRRHTDVSQYLFRYWQLVTGQFVPISIKDTRYLGLKSIIECKEASEMIRTQKYNLICLNDKFENDTEFYQAKTLIQNAFKTILPDKSSFEI